MDPTIGPRGVNDKAIGRITGRARLTTLTTFLMPRLMPRPIGLKISSKNPNSRCPVTGLMELASSPTVYLAGSMPAARIWPCNAAFNRGLRSRTAAGTTVSFGARCAMYSSSKRPNSARWSPIFLTEPMPEVGVSKSGVAQLPVLAIKKLAIPPSGISNDSSSLSAK